MATECNTHKPFMTYEQQIQKLLDKKLVITDIDYAITLLKDYSYFDLINGYKKQFKTTSGFYKPHTTIYALYVFDDNLRSLFLQYILKIEKHIKSYTSYIFCHEYGEKQEAYLNTKNYSYNKQSKKSIDSLIQILQDVIKTSTRYTYIEHQKATHGNVPLWVLMKALTLGKVSKIYAYLPQKLQNTIAKEFVLLKENVLLKMLEILAHCRNVCAHNERLYDHSFRKSTIDNTEIHTTLHIPKRGKQFIKGKNDLFAIVITLKYLLKPEDFKEFFEHLTITIEMLFSSTTQIPHVQMFKYMGFPENWREIRDL